MDDRQQSNRAEREINLGEYFAILRRAWWKILSLSLAVSCVTLGGSFYFPNIYQAEAVITPAIDEKKPYPVFGALASFGLDIGGPSRVEDLETLFRSKDLAVRVFKKYNLWPIVLSDRFNAKTGKMQFSWTDRVLRRETGEREPSDWDAIRAAKKGLRVTVNKRAGTVTVSFESRDANGAARIVEYFLEEGKSRLQEEGLDRAIKNKKFIEEQIGKTVDPLTKDRLYSLYGQEVEHEMLAKNRDQFGFRVIDYPRIPDRKVKPNRIAVSLAIGIASVPFWVVGYVLINRKTKLGG